MERLPGDDLEQQRSDRAADDRADNGDPAICKVAGALALDGQNRMGAAGAEVTGGVDGIAGEAAEGHTDGHDDAEHEQLLNAGGAAGNIADAEDGEHQDEGADDLREQVQEDADNQKKDNIFSYIKPDYLLIKRDAENPRVAMMCKYRYEPEHGLTVVFPHDGQIVVGIQDIIL